MQIPAEKKRNIKKNYTQKNYKPKLYANHHIKKIASKKLMEACPDGNDFELSRMIIKLSTVFVH